MRGKLGCFFVELERLFSNFFSYFFSSLFIYSFFLLLTPELFGIGIGGTFFSGNTLLF